MVPFSTLLFPPLSLPRCWSIPRHPQAGSADVPVGSSVIEQVDFEFVLFAFAVIDYDYIMGLIARFSSKAPPQRPLISENPGFGDDARPVKRV